MARRTGPPHPRRGIPSRSCGQARVGEGRPWCKTSIPSGGRRPKGQETTAMDVDEDKIDQTVLGLMYLTLHDSCRAWKGFDWDVLDRLHDKGMIGDPKNKAK